ncbi:hypothetical protein [Chromohalobacter israelensis]
MNYLIDLLKSISFSPKRLTRKAYSTDTAVIVKAKGLSGQSVTASELPCDEWRLARVRILPKPARLSSEIVRGEPENLKQVSHLRTSFTAGHVVRRRQRMRTLRIRRRERKGFLAQITK